MSRSCPNCGAEFPEEQKYCANCGEERRDAPKAAPAAASRPPKKDFTKDENVRQLLSRYSARKISILLAAACIILTVMWLSYFRNMPMSPLEHFFVVLFYPVLAFLLLSYPSYYVIKVRQNLKNMGYTREYIDDVLNDNPFWFKNYRPKGPEDQKKFRASGTVLSVAAWIIIACGVIAIVQPLAVMFLSGNADLTRSETGALILAAGILALTAGKVCKTLAERK